MSRVRYGSRLDRCCCRSGASSLPYPDKKPTRTRRWRTSSRPSSPRGPGTSCGPHRESHSRAQRRVSSSLSAARSRKGMRSTHNRDEARWSAVECPRVTHGYRLRVEDQAGAADTLRHVGALTEIEQAVVAHCEEHAPKPPYRPQEIKKRLAPSWRPEVRVPPFEPQYDDLPINDRYDLWKSFELDGGAQIGVAIEMERWEVWTDLLRVPARESSTPSDRRWRDPARQSREPALRLPSSAAHLRAAFQRASGRVRSAGRRGIGDGRPSEQSPLCSLPDAQRSGCLTIAVLKIS